MELKIKKEEAEIIKNRYWTRNPEEEGLLQYVRKIVDQEVKERGFTHFHMSMIQPHLKDIAIEYGLSYEHLASKISYNPMAWLIALSRI